MCCEWLKQEKHRCVCRLQLDCCGKGTMTNFFTRITDKLGQTNLCPTSGTLVVSLITAATRFHVNISTAAASFHSGNLN